MARTPVCDCVRVRVLDVRVRVLGLSAVWPLGARACPWFCASVSVFRASVSPHVPVGALGVAVIWLEYFAAVP